MFALLILVACGAQASPTTGPVGATQTAAVDVKEISATQAAVSTMVAPVVKAGQTAIAPTTAAGLTQVAATKMTAATQVAPTIQAGQPTAQALATHSAPTVAAISTAAAPTAAAILTQVAGTMPAVLSTRIAASPVEITGVKLSPTDTTVTIRNTSGAFPDLNGWLVVGPRLAFPLPRNLMILPGTSLNVHFGPGIDTSTDVYLGTGAQQMAQHLATGDPMGLMNERAELESIYIVR
jgi:hypothetical protein